MKKSVHSGYKALVQILKYLENEYLFDKKDFSESKDDAEIGQNRKVKNEVLIKKLKFKNISLTPKAPNNIVLFHSGKFFKIYKITAESKNESEPEKIKIFGHMIEITEFDFDFLIKLSELGICKVKLTPNHKEPALVEASPNAIELDRLL